MSELTPEQLARMQRDLGDINEAFGEDELQDLWTQEGENWNKAVRRGFDWLLSSTAKFADYTQNESQERKSQIFANLLKLRDIWDKKVANDKEESVGTDAQRQVVMFSLRPGWRRKGRPYA